MRERRKPGHTLKCWHHAAGAQRLWPLCLQLLPNAVLCARLYRLYQDAPCRELHNWAEDAWATANSGSSNSGAQQGLPLRRASRSPTLAAAQMFGQPSLYDCSHDALYTVPPRNMLRKGLTSTCSCACWHCARVCRPSGAELSWGVFVAGTHTACCNEGRGSSDRNVTRKTARRPSSLPMDISIERRPWASKLIFSDIPAGITLGKKRLETVDTIKPKISNF